MEGGEESKLTSLKDDSKAKHKAIDPTELPDIEENREEYEAAATKIGAAFRGKKAREEIAEMQDAALKIGAVYRGKKARQEVTEKRKIIQE
jgi:hypothetical protein